jgi:tRNA splicing endonuclease
VETLSKLVETLTSGKGNEADVVKLDDVADDEPMTKKQVDAYFSKKLAEQAETANSTANAEKSINDQIQALETNKQTPDAKDYADDLKAIMAKHTSLSAYAAYRMLQGEGVIPIDGVNRSNANRTGTGTRSKTNLLDSKSAADMSKDDMLTYLKGAEKSGDLNGLI